MQTQNNISLQKQEICQLIQKSRYHCVDIYDIPKVKQSFSEIDAKLYEIIINNPLGCLGQPFINGVNEYVFKEEGFRFSQIQEIWQVNMGLDSYVNASNERKAEILKYIGQQYAAVHKLEVTSDFPTSNGAEKVVETAQHLINPKLYDPLLRFLKISEHSNLQIRREALDQKFVKAIYLSEDQGLIELFMQHLPIPPLHIFDIANQPVLLVQKEKERQASLVKFNKQNVNDADLERKITCVQRHIRAKIRHESEKKRISKLYFSDFEMPQELAIHAMEDANTPYKPKRCSPEFSDSILQAATKVKLFSSATHVAALKYLVSMLEGCLNGRKNLVDNYTEFRPAALGLCDIGDGDFNAVFLGMDKIDSRCFEGMTVGLEFYLEALIGAGQFNKNPTIFYKQRDFGYHFDDIQQIRIGKKVVYFSHTRKPEYLKKNCVSLRIFDSNSEKYPFQKYCSSIPKYSFISNNVENMNAILSLNFFRFIDTLQDCQGNHAEKEIESIYKEIAGLNEQELIDFLTDVGKKMSCSAEFNFSGSYKIDLNALKSVSLYRDQDKKYTVEMDALYEELSENKAGLLKELMEYIPEIFESQRFTEHLTSKVPK